MALKLKSGPGFLSIPKKLKHKLSVKGTSFTVALELGKCKPTMCNVTVSEYMMDFNMQMKVNRLVSKLLDSLMIEMSMASSYPRSILTLLLENASSFSKNKHAPLSVAHMNQTVSPSYLVYPTS